MYRELTAADMELITAAKEVIARNFDGEKENHTVGVALRCKSGEVYLGVNVYWMHGTCAEGVALGTAITAGEREFDCLVGGRGGDSFCVLPPCGNCRQMLVDYCPDCDVIIDTQEGLKKVKAAELLPHAYMRG